MNSKARTSRWPSLGIVSIVLMLVAALPAAAWKGSIVSGIVSIADVQEKAEVGDYFAVQGVVIKKEGKRLFTIQDDTGEMIVLIPENLTRSNGMPRMGEQVVLSGKYDREKLNKQIHGMRVSTLELQGRVTGGGPAAQSPTTTTTPEPIDREAIRPSSEPGVMAPTVSAAWKQRLTTARQEWLAAVEASKNANGDYARAIYQAGSDEAVDPALRQSAADSDERLRLAEDDVADLVEQAREDGVSEETLRLYERATQRPR